MSNLTKEQITAIKNIHKTVMVNDPNNPDLYKFEMVFPFLINGVEPEPVLTETWTIDDVIISLEGTSQYHTVKERYDNNDMEFFKGMFEYLSNKVFDANTGWAWDSLSFGVISYLDALELNGIGE